MKQVTVVWLRGGIDIFLNVTQVQSELVQWKLDKADGSIVLVPMCNVKTLTVVSNGED